MQNQRLRVAGDSDGQDTKLFFAAASSSSSSASSLEEGEGLGEAAGVREHSDSSGEHTWGPRSPWSSRAGEVERAAEARLGGGGGDDGGQGDAAVTLTQSSVGRCTWAPASSPRR